MSPARSLAAALSLMLAGLGALWLGGCGPNAKDQAVLHAAHTVTSGWRTLGKVDAARQENIRALAASSPAGAREALKKHGALYALFEKALDNAGAIIARIDREGLIAALLADLAKAVTEVTTAGMAYERGGAP